jgi:hypothetical protein
MDRGELRKRVDESPSCAHHRDAMKGLPLRQGLLVDRNLAHIHDVLMPGPAVHAACLGENWI